MAINSLNDYSTTPASNTDIAGTNISIGCPPQDVGVYMRTQMAQIAYAVKGTGGPIPTDWYCTNLHVTNINGHPPVLSGGPAVPLNGTTVTGTTATFTGQVQQTGGAAALFAGSTTSNLGGYWILPSGGAPASGGINYSLVGTGFIVSNSGFFANSDARTKTDVKEITAADAIAWVLNGRPVTFMKDGQLGSGFIAQEDVRAGRGASVSFVEDDDPRFAEGDDVVRPGFRLVKNYEQEIAYLSRVLQDALARIADLEGRART